MRQRHLPRRSAATALAVGIGLTVSTATLAAPSEVPNLAWCSGAKTCLQWDVVPGASQYHVYRGERVSLACLLNPAFDSCSDASVGTTSTGTTLTEVPAAGGVYWYLVTAVAAGSEGTFGLATAGPRDSEHTGACGPSCAPAGAICSVSGDCCSASCVSGTCQTACCVSPGAGCSQNADCCSGACSFGVCQAACAPTGSSCAGGNDCCGAAGASGNCVGNVCGITCSPGFANCDGSIGNGCECAGNLCCGGACEPVHVNGLGQSFDDCSAPGVPGTASTYTYALAVAARAAWPFTGTDVDAICGTGTNITAVYRQTATTCAVWQFSKSIAGHVNLNTANSDCTCPTASDPVWY
jgi:hypothetical protein